MRSVLIAGVSAAALAVSGCSMFQSHKSTAANAGTGAESTTQIPSGSQPTMRMAQPQPPASPMPEAQSSTMRSQPAPSSAMPSSGAATSARPDANTAAAGTTGDDHVGGSHRQTVEEAQLKLKSIGLYSGKLDGIAGPQTKQAVSQFQQRNGLTQTGRLDHATLAKLDIGSGAGVGSSTPARSGAGHDTTPSSGPAAPGTSK